MAPALGIGQCCASGSLHTGTPTGRIAKVHGLDCYIADAPNGPAKGAVVIIPDVFGWVFPNNRVLADCYAKEGNFQVYLPDLMDGHVVPESLLISIKALSATGLWNQIAKIGHAASMAYNVVPFLIKTRGTITNPRTWSFLKALRENECKDMPIGTAGFCWGGYFTVRHAWDDENNRTKDGKRIVDYAFAAHPSFMSYPTDIEKIQRPFSCAAAEHDPQMSAANAEQTQKILNEKTAKTKDQGIEHEFVMYPGVHHGFAVRADEDQKEEAEAGKKAEKQAVDFFSRYFAKRA